VKFSIHFIGSPKCTEAILGVIFRFHGVIVYSYEDIVPNQAVQQSGYLLKKNIFYDIYEHITQKTL